MDGVGTGGDEPSHITAFASTQVESVVAFMADGSSYDGQLFPMPDQYIGPSQAVLVLVPHGVELRGDLVGLGADGDEIARLAIEGPQLVGDE